VLDADTMQAYAVGDDGDDEGVLDDDDDDDDDQEPFDDVDDDDDEAAANALLADEQDQDIVEDAVGIYVEHSGMATQRDGPTCCECLIRCCYCCCCCCSDSIYSVDARVLPTGPQGSEEVRVVSGGGDDVARVWNPRTGKTFFTLAGHADTVLDVKFNHDSMMIATASMDGTVRVWDSITGALHSVLEGPSDSLDVCWYFTTMLPISYTQLVSLSLSLLVWLVGFIHGNMTISSGSHGTPKETLCYQEVQMAFVTCGWLSMASQ
jgi:hypothetical protein